MAAFVDKGNRLYNVDDRDRVKRLTDVPQSDIGAPLPIVIANEGYLGLLFYLSEPDPNWDGTYVNVVSTESNDMAIAIVEFQLPTTHTLGPPNDEAFSGHPLATRGLRPYAAFEIADSSWIRQLEIVNSVHPYHDRDRFMSDKRHFIFAFHDSVFECVARSYKIELTRGSLIQIGRAHV